MSERIERFRQRVEELVARFEADVDRSEWVTRRYPKKLGDGGRDAYVVPALLLQKGTIRLLLDPVGYDVPGAEGAADLYQMPAYDPMASLYLEGGDWVVHFAPPNEAISETETQAMPLSSATINQTLDAIYDHATTAA